MGKVGRPSLGLRNVLVGFPEDVLARVEAAAGTGGRSEFIRTAVVRALDGGVSEVRFASVVGSPEKSEPVAPAALVPVAAAEDREAMLLKVVRGRGALSSRDAAQCLGWSEMLVSKVEARLSARALIHYPRGAGVMVAVDG